MSTVWNPVEENLDETAILQGNFPFSRVTSTIYYFRELI